MKLANKFFSWFKYHFICTDVRALNAAIFIHSTPKGIIGKEYFVWRSQISFLADLSKSSYVPMLQRRTLSFSYIQRHNSIIGKEYFVWSSQFSFFSLFRLNFPFLYVGALNATFFVHSSPKCNIGKEYCVLSCQISSLFELRIWYVDMFFIWYVEVAN